MCVCVCVSGSEPRAYSEPADLQFHNNQGQLLQPAFGGNRLGPRRHELSCPRSALPHKGDLCGLASVRRERLWEHHLHGLSCQKSGVRDVHRKTPLHVPTYWVCSRRVICLFCVFFSAAGRRPTAPLVRRQSDRAGEVGGVPEVEEEGTQTSWWRYSSAR